MIPTKYCFTKICTDALLVARGAKRSCQKGSV